VKSANLFLNYKRQVFRENCGHVPLERVRISMASSGSDAGLTGAAQVSCTASRRAHTRCLQMSALALGIEIAGGAGPSRPPESPRSSEAGG
jgi:hypothetical protein